MAQGSAGRQGQVYSAEAEEAMVEGCVCEGVGGGCCKGGQTVSSSPNKTTVAINAKLKALTTLYSNFHMAISLPS